MTSASEMFPVVLGLLVAFALGPGVLLLAWFTYRGGFHDLWARRAARRSAQRD